MFSSLTPKVVAMIQTGVWQTIYMVAISSLLAYAIGLPLGILLVVTDKDGIKPIGWLNKLIGIIVNIIRSIPFLIFMVAVMPLTRSIVGTTIGTKATMVPLVLAAGPFVARMVETSFKEVDAGVVEAAQSMGATTWNIIWKVLLPEAKPSLTLGSTIAITTILGYSAMAGFVGGGGLGAIAVNYGYNRYQDEIMLVTVVLMVILVQVIQEVGMRIARAGDKRL